MRTSTVFEFSKPATSDISIQEVEIWRRIKHSLESGHDIEIKRLPDGRLKVLEIQKKNIIG